MKPLRTAAILVCLNVASWSANSVSHPSYWRYAHPQAKVLVGIEWQRIVQSPLAAKLQQEMAQAGLTRMMSAQGLDFIWEVERVFISSPGGGKKDQPPLVAALQGRFDLAKVRESITKLGAKANVYKGVALLAPDKAGADQVLALASASVLLFGDRVSVQAALDNYSAAAPPPAGSKLYQRAADLSSRFDLWFAGVGAPGDLAGAAAMPQAQMLADVESFEAGVSLQNGLGLELSLNSKTEESAKALAGAVQGLMGLAAMHAGANPEAAEFLKKLHVKTEHARVSLALSIDQAELEKGIQQIRASAGPAMAGVQVRPKITGTNATNLPALPHAAVIPVAPIKPAEPAVIRIYGAEGGTKEIPLARP